jgi:hypothetical protein
MHPLEELKPVSVFGGAMGPPAGLDLEGGEPGAGAGTTEITKKKLECNVLKWFKKYLVLFYKSVFSIVSKMTLFHIFRAGW